MRWLTSQSTFAMLVAALTACGAVNQRPYLQSLPGATVDTAHTTPAVLIAEIETLVAAEGLEVRLSTPSEGYLETRWYDTEASRSLGERTRDPHHVVRLRFFTRPIGDQLTELTAEAVIRRRLDPSLPDRETEMLVPAGHPGGALLSRILAVIEERFGAEHS
jgi:hypothetical protein